ncbi:succinic semialdehyde dehydrogenase [Nesterenkonia muleiensis]|uniref:succinic semialdehyde dehydrogenase n=1 Tax=Nesterenkonia muleiensis TaxID=2282648 RepID=UPI000E756B66|nr:succinic semialdehyde dehydrogenase [Nesterenkonia muleiensis]
MSTPHAAQRHDAQPQAQGLADLVSSTHRAGEVWVSSPFDGTLVGTLPASSDEDVHSAVAAARDAHQEWAARPVAERVAPLLEFRELVLQHSEELLDLVQLETGKARSSALEEIADIVLWSSYLVHHGPRALRSQRRSSAFPLLTRTTEHHKPIGVVGVITPWNYPLTLPVTDSLPALLAGNAVVLKPDEQTSHTALRLLSLLRHAGIPEDLMQIVVGSGPEAGAALVDCADYLMFTGSSATGARVAARCAERLIGFSGELGGKNPMLILDDADTSRAAATAAQSCFSNAGQLCVSIERIYIHDSVWEEFTTRFLRRVSQLKLAPGLTWQADVGSLISEQQLKVVAEHVEDAVEKGATVLTGGKPRPDLGPFFYEPTVLTDVTEQMALHSTETFGPVVSLYRVTSEEEAIAAANDSPYGLNASVFSAKRGPAVARRLQTGSVNINDGYAASWISLDAPMGGMKRSGVGRRHGTQGILKYTESQTVARQRFASVARPAGVGRRLWAQMMLRGINVLKRLR